MGNIAAYIPVGRDHCILYDFISKMLEMYVNIGLEAKKLSDKTGLLKATNSAGNLGKDGFYTTHVFFMINIITSD